MKEDFSRISSVTDLQFEVAADDPRATKNIYTQDFAYIDAPNLSNDDRLKFRVDTSAGTVTIGNLNSYDGESVSVPLASISGNYYANIQKIEHTLNNPQRSFLHGLMYMEKSAGSNYYDTVLPNWCYHENWFNN